MLICSPLTKNIVYIWQTRSTIGCRYVIISLQVLRSTVFILVNRAIEKIGFLTTDNYADTFKEIIKGK